ncbi:hypothetical protein ABH930_006402 [Kitasatospora sp. GAS204A]|uniref:hypothetical protein n=1 Tax=unclassified Kitasatospora TaxID=2633591 RepID=UPI0024768861|nr:hypothetical protein [Kitasatospora sp. GAS204B]MDH6122006.1 hypothetical protein [Kitasatospora sp. GAS204B]
MDTTAALDAAKARLAIGWPLLILAIALYSPLHGAAQLVVLAAGLFFLSRQPAGASIPRTQPSKPAARGRDEKGKWTK